MPRKSRKKAQPEAQASEPTPIAAVLEASPAMEEIRASREAKSQVEPEHELPSPDRQLPAPTEPQEPAGHAAKHSERVHRMQPPPEGFRPVSSFPAAGIRVNKSHDRGTVAIQFDEAFPAIRGGANSEVELLAEQGLRFEPLRRQWERTDTANPGVNVIGAQRFGQQLAERRTGREL